MLQSPQNDSFLDYKWYVPEILDILHFLMLCCSLLIKILLASLQNFRYLISKIHVTFLAEIHILDIFIFFHLCDRVSKEI